MDDPAENPALVNRADNGASELSQSAPLPLPTADETYRYEAFVSYRHTARDRAWAKWLHTGLESYRVPDALVRRGLRARIGRVFQDEEAGVSTPHDGLDATKAPTSCWSACCADARDAEDRDRRVRMTTTVAVEA